MEEWMHTGAVSIVVSMTGVLIRRALVSLTERVAAVEARQARLEGYLQGSGVLPTAGGVLP